MSRITYTALREFEKTIAVTSAGISAAAADDSFNSASGLSGFLNDEWIFVSGFANAANNGWFQLNGNSSATKISQDTTTSLVTESAGPTVTIQGYKRGLNQSYDLEFYTERLDRSVQVSRSTKQPMGGGAPEVLLRRRDAFIDVSVIGPLGEPLTEEQIPQWREFLASVEGGEPFVFDRYGTVAVPVELLTVMLASESYAEERVASRRLYKLAFQVKVV